ncbi:hypothetical protein QZH41_008289 [Actinostola sp. cb2023]|nr:hypothetical protein QZH41_008289 [Actinostola sp. cb2023]
MGHVDHGKTTLLDALRNSSIAAGEAGGITQHIGAFLVTLPSEELITFIDTPGHAAFESIRARGANVTDIVVLVVAADDGVKTQTVESIRHAVHAKVPIVVAINKIDKGKKNIDLLKQQLLSHGIQLEEYGGEVQVVEISALKGTNLDSLTEAIITLAEINNLRANKDTNVEGVVIEAKKDKGLGPVVTALIQNGTLKKGDIIVAGSTFAKVRQMYTDSGKVVDVAPPSTPVQVTGWKELPAAGEKILQVESETTGWFMLIIISLQGLCFVPQKKANELASSRKAYEEQKKKASLSEGFSVENLMKEEHGRRTKTSKGEYDATNKIDVVVKGDVDGSVEAVVDAIKTYKSDKIKLSVLHADVGSVSEYDIKKAHSFKGVVLGFNIKIPKEIQQLAKQMNVQIKNHRVIYKLLADLKDEMSSRLPPIKEEKTLGEAEILKVFKLTGVKKAWVAGCRVRQGVLNKDSRCRIVRGDNTIYEGKFTSLKRGPDAVDIVKKEQECGLSFEKFSGFKEGDRIECFQINTVPDEVDWEWGF